MGRARAGMKTQREQGNRSIREQAAWWLTELQDDAPTVRAQFAAWLRESPRHVEEFLLFNALWQELDAMDPQRRMNLEQLIEQAKAAHVTANVVYLQDTAGDSRHAGSWWGRSWKLVAGLMAFGIGTVLAWPWLSPQLEAFADFRADTRTYVTTIGEQRTIKLPDDSVVYLNARSRLRVGYSDRVREVILLEGEALFCVDRDAHRPFRVRAGDAVVQAIGTQFNVYRRPESTTVSVIEGVVQISNHAPNAPARPLAIAPERLTAGRQAVVSASGAIAAQTPPDIDRALAWRERRLVFQSDPLEKIAAEFNRYNVLQIRIEGDALRAKRLIGTFDADDPESLVQFLAKEPNVLVERSGKELAIRLRE